MATMKQAIILERYDICLEAWKLNKSMLMKLNKSPPIFETLIIQLERITSNYESKIVIINECMPLLRFHTVERLIKIFERVLDYPQDESIFRNNLNPLRTGLMLYKLIVDLQAHSGFS